MASLNRRRFMLLSAVALLGAACSSAEPTGLRGNGTILYPRDADPQATPPPAIDPTLEPTSVRPIPTLAPTPMPVSIVASDAVPALPAGSTDAEMHVVPVLAGKPPITAALPARRIIIPTLGLDSKVIQLGTKLDRHGVMAWETAPFEIGRASCR